MNVNLTETYKSAPQEVKNLLDSIQKASKPFSLKIKIIPCRCKPGQWPCECESADDSNGRKDGSEQVEGN